jgi:hypothetical protein
LAPHLVGPVDLHIGLPDAFDLRHQGFVTLSACAAPVRLSS